LKQVGTGEYPESSDENKTLKKQKKTGGGGKEHRKEGGSSGSERLIAGWQDVGVGAWLGAKEKVYGCVEGVGVGDPNGFAS